MPRVSVIIPCYNAQKFLSEAIDGVLRQTYRDFEIVPVDNASTDRTLEILQGYADAVRIVQERRRGASQARNAGIAASRGEFLAFLDADDFWEPRKLEAQVKLMDERPDLGMVATDYWLAVQTGDRCVRGKWIRFDRRDYLDALFWGYPCHISTVMVRREVVANVGGFNEGIAVCEDTEFLLRVAEAYGVQNCPEPLSTYRRHPNATVTARRETLQEMVDRNDEIIADFCRRHPRYEPHRRRHGARMRAWAGRLLLTRDRAGALHFYRDAFRLDPASAPALLGLVASKLPLPYGLFRDLKRRVRDALRQ